MWSDITTWCETDIVGSQTTLQRLSSETRHVTRRKKVKHIIRTLAAWTRRCPTRRAPRNLPSQLGSTKPSVRLYQPHSGGLDSSLSHSPHFFGGTLFLFRALIFSKVFSVLLRSGLGCQDICQWPRRFWLRVSGHGHIFIGSATALSVHGEC